MTAGMHRNPGLTYFVADVLVRECARRRFAEQHHPPFAPLREFQAFVVNLVRQLPRRREDDRANALSCVTVRARDR